MSGVTRDPKRNARTTPAAMAMATTTHGISFVVLAGGGSGGADRIFTTRKLSYDSKLTLRGRSPLLRHSPSVMARYIDDDSDSGHTLLITAGVVAGLLAGAVVAQRMGGLRGIRRLLGRRRAPLLKLLKGVLPSGTLGAVLDVVGIDQIIGALMGTVRSERRAVGATRRRRRRPDPELDEYEVDDFERAAAGLDDDDEDTPPARTLLDDEEADDEDVEDEIVDTESPEAIEGEVLAAFRRHPVLRHRALEIAVDDEGVVELTGWVRKERELRIARRVAGRVEGVERVVVDVSVRDAERDVVRAVSAEDAEASTS